MVYLFLLELSVPDSLLYQPTSNQADFGRFKIYHGVPMFVRNKVADSTYDMVGLILFLLELSVPDSLL